MRNTVTSMRTIVIVMELTLAATLVIAQPPAQAPAARTAAQAYRNIQLLKDIPSTQLIPTMRFISASLGVECEFCHLGDRSADTDHKNTARKMMTMMMAINKDSFGGQREVTCYTCHHGTNNPVGTPTPTGDEVMSQAYREYVAKDRLAGLPTPDQILAKYVAALGGEQALRRVTARLITGTAELPGDVRGAAPAIHVPVQQYFKAPNQWVMTFQMGNGSTLNGFDGTVAWIQAANGVVTEATGVTNAPLPPLARVKRNADFYEPLNLKQQYPRLTVRGLEKVRGVDAYVVVGVPDGDLPERLFFDTQTGLLVRKSTAVATALGNYPIQTDYDDYRDVGGVKFPYLVRTVAISPADDLTIHVEKVQNNPTVDAGKFAKPASRPAAAR